MINVNLHLNLFPLEVVQNANIVNFVYYGKTKINYDLFETIIPL